MQCKSTLQFMVPPVINAICQTPKDSCSALFGFYIAFLGAIMPSAAAFAQAHGHP